LILTVNAASAALAIPSDAEFVGDAPRTRTMREPPNSLDDRMREFEFRIQIAFYSHRSE
jgi:hypothetical protein